MVTSIFIYFLLFMYYSWAFSYYTCSLLKPRFHFPHPRMVSFLAAAAVMVPAAFLKMRFFILGTAVLHILVFSVIVILFADKLRQKLLYFLFFSLFQFLIELISACISMFILYIKDGTLLTNFTFYGNSIPALMLMVFLEIFVGINFYRKTVPLLQSCMPFLKTQTCMLLISSATIPFIAWLFVYHQYQTPDFVWLSVLYWLLCGICYPAFFKGMKNMREQQQKKEAYEQQILLIKEQIAYSQKLEKEYQRLRRWNHDAENHLLALSYLMDMKKYEEAVSYCTSLTEKDH